MAGWSCTVAEVPPFVKVRLFVSMTLNVFKLRGLYGKYFCIFFFFVNQINFLGLLAGLQLAVNCLVYKMTKSSAKS